MLAFLLDGYTSETNYDWEEIEGVTGMSNEITMNQRVAALVSLLKVARSLFLVEGEIVADVKQGQLDLKNCKDDFDSTLEAAVFIKGQVIHVPICLLELALTHIEDGLRIDAAELLGLNPKTASMPSYLELYLLKHAIPLNMRCSSTAFRMKWTTLLKKFFSRVRTAVERQIKTRHAQNRASVTDTIKTVEENRLIELPMLAIEANRRVAVTVEDMQDFMTWLSQLVIYSLYPSGPYERKNMAMELFGALLEVWSLSEFSSGLLHGGAFTPYHIELLSAESTLVLVSAVVDSWDRLRENAYKILVRYPTPLPGMDTEYAVQGLLKWAKGLVRSPRVRESDAGALVLRLVFRKYVCENAWMVQVHANPEDVIVRTPRFGLEKDKLWAGEVGEAICLYIDSLNNWLEVEIQEGEKDLLAACKHSLVHGVLLTLRYTMDEIDWMSDAVRAGASRLQSALKRLLGLVLRVTSLTLGVVSADALNIREHMLRDRNLDDVDRIFDDTGVSIYEDGGELGDLDHFIDNKLEMLAPAEQMMMVGCWLSMKEVSLLLGTITRRAPLSGCAVAVESQHGLISTSDAPNIIGTKGNHQVLALLDAEQLGMIGEHFLHVLFSMKHNGAVDKTRAGFSALCNRLLHAHNARLGKMPEIWLQQLMERTCSKGQTVDDLLRRSAGLPAAFLALFLAEPDGAPRKLLPITMKWLLSLAKNFLLESTATSDSETQSSKIMNGEIINSSAERKASRMGSSEDVSDLPKAIKAREEGVVPAVHAFNVLKVAFHDTNLATDTSGFCAEGLIVAIQAFSSRHWEVRNSATLAFTALVHRTVGFLNVHKRETARRTISGFEFFNRYPTLHPFLLQELKFATVHLEHASSGNVTTVSTMSNALHPSLAPILIILSRLKPSAINTGVEDWLSPSLFMPFVTRCATQRNLKVRVLASQALPPLVSSENLSKVLIELANGLPVANKIGITMYIRDSVDSESCTNHRPAAPNERPCVFKYNAIHGTLLQICALLEHNTATLSDFQEQEKIVFDVFELVQSCLWLGSTRLCSCYVVISEFLHVLQVLSEVAEVIEKAGMSSEKLTRKIRSVLLDLCAQCLDNRGGLAGRLWDANAVRLLERAADLYFSTVFKALLLEDVTELGKETSLKLFKGKPLSDIPGANGQAVASSIDLKISCINPSDENLLKHLRGLIARLRDALADDVYEVRLVTLKALKHCDRVSIVQMISEGPLHPYSCRFGLDFRQLHLLLIDRLMAESQPKCLNCLLHLLFTWQLLSVDCQGVFSGVRNTYLEDIYPQQGTESCERPTLPAQICEVAKYFSTTQLWNRLIEIYETAKVAKMKEMTIRCLGGCLSRLIADIKGLFSERLHSCYSICVEEDLQLCNGQSDNLSSQASGVVHEVGQCAGLPGARSVNEPDMLQNPPSCFRHCFEESKVDNWKALSKAVDEWILLIAKHSAASEPVTFRRAVAEAIAASGILKDVSWVSKHVPGYLQIRLSNLSKIERDCYLKCEWYGRSILSIWSICIKLLEDEDLTLRQTLATSILSIVGSCGRNDRFDTVLAQVEMVIVMSFNHLTECLAHWNVYFDFLALWTFGSKSFSCPKDGDVDLVRRLFDKEIDNHHEEELFIVQLCCLQLQKILILKGRQTYSSSSPFVSTKNIFQQNHTFPAILGHKEDNFSSELGIGEDDQDYLSIANAKANLCILVNSWRLKFLDEAIVCARWCNMAQSSTQWLGGITSHQDAFGVLYRNLLGVYSLIGPSSNLSDNFSNVLQEHSTRDFVSRITELAGSLGSIPLNPIIYNLLGACLVGYECHFGVDLDSTLCKGIVIDSTTSKFEPFFLIK
ncbi:hypothetical protein O6H91_18G018000 [Diphasiastrum complanatum]|nr:hypothetical protein O6H91_18G018000 [Diphasiastrum complanatum]